MVSKISHEMPKSIRRVAQGVYRSHDEAIEIRQSKEGWTATVLAEVEGRELKVGQVLTEKPLRTRGDAVKLLDEQGLLPPAPPKPAKPKPEAKPEKQLKAEDQPQAQVTETTQGIGGRNGSKPKEQPKRRPRTRKVEKEAVKV
jgi:hypothetical protein